jgi:hypothetical protein
MQAAFEIFLNGIFGVFIGLAALYAAIKINQFAANREAPKREE